MKKLLLVVLLLAVVGCNEAQKTPVKSVGDHLIPTRQDWKDTYGDTIDTRVAYNLALIRNDQRRIFQRINNLHPDVDPNN